MGSGRRCEKQIPFGNVEWSYRIPVGLSAHLKCILLGAPHMEAMVYSEREPVLE